jgi:G3E family GTPase
MSSYVLKNTVPGRIFDIRLGGSKIGCVRKIDDHFLAFTTGSGPMRRAQAHTAQAAFQDLVAILNRIDLCGEDDAAKARAALAERNARTEAHNAQVRKDMEPLREAFEQALGVRLPVRRPSYKKVLL